MLDHRPTIGRRSPAMIQTTTPLQRFNVVITYREKASTPKLRHPNSDDGIPTWQPKNCEAIYGLQFCGTYQLFKSSHLIEEFRSAILSNGFPCIPRSRSTSPVRKACGSRVCPPGHIASVKRFSVVGMTVLCDLPVRAVTLFGPGGRSPPSPDATAMGRF